MRIAVLTTFLVSMLAVPCALPVHGQQEWTRPRSSETASESASSAEHPATAKEMLTQRLRQLREEKQGGTEMRSTARAVATPLHTSGSGSPHVDSAGVDRAVFESTGQTLKTVETAGFNSENPDPDSKPFLDLTQNESPDAEKHNETLSADSGNAEVVLSSSPIQVLMRAVAWIVIALCICSLTFLGLRRWQRQRGLLPTTNAKCRVLETLSLGPGRTVSLIEMAGFRALVASDAGGIRSLVLTPADFQDELNGAGVAQSE